MWIPRGTVDPSRATATPLVRFFFLDPSVSHGLELRGSHGPVEPSQVSQLGAKDLKEVGIVILFKDDAETVEALTGRLSDETETKGNNKEYCLVLQTELG